MPTKKATKAELEEFYRRTQRGEDFSLIFYEVRLKSFGLGLAWPFPEEKDDIICIPERVRRIHNWIEITFGSDLIHLKISWSLQTYNGESRPFLISAMNIFHFPQGLLNLSLFNYVKTLLRV